MTAGESQLAIPCATRASLWETVRRRAGGAAAPQTHSDLDPYCGLFSPVSMSACRQIIVATAAGGTPDDIQERERESPLGPAQTGTDNPNRNSSRLLPLLPGPPPHLRDAADGAAWLPRHLQAQTMGLSVRTAGADRGPRAAYCAPHTHADEVWGRRMGGGREGSGAEGGVGPCVRHPADDGTLFLRLRTCKLC